jgi:F-type H+-transporting ATPase subunit b
MAAAFVLAASDLIKVVPGLMIWTLIAFAITFFVLRRYAFGPIQKAIDERREKIRQSIEDADRARDEAHKLLEQHNALVAQARGDAESILAEARKVADTQRERLKQELDAERARRVDETRKEIEAETRRSIETIRHEVADLTLEATSKVTGKVLDDEDHRRLIEEAIGDLDFSVLEKETA